MQALFGFLMLGDTLGLSAANWKEEDETSSSSWPRQITHSTNIVEHALIILKCMVIKHVSMNLVSLSKKNNPC